MKELPKADKLTIALLLLPPATAAEERELVIGDASIGGDSGGEFNPALQVVLLSVRSPVTINITVNLISAVFLCSVKQKDIKGGPVSRSNSISG